MKSQFLSNPLDLNADLGLGGGDFNFGPLFSGLGNNGLSKSPMASTPTPPDESVQAAAAVSASGSGGPGSIVAETSSTGFTINLIFDAAAMAAPASFRTGIEQAAAILSSTINDKITVNISIDYSGTGGGAFAGPAAGQFVSYSTVRADLIATAAPGDTSFNALPTGSTIQGQSNVAVWNAQLKVFGLLSATATGVDGNASFATDINPNLLVGVALHELTHALGRVPYGPPDTSLAPDASSPDIFDFYRFTSAGNYLFADGKTAPPAYFSLDGGHTKVADFGQNSDPSDFLNNGVQGGNDPFNEFYTSSTLQTLTTVDREILDALGFNTTALSSVMVIEAHGATALLQSGSDYFLNPVSNLTTVAGPELMFNGAPVTVGMWAGWAPVGAEQVGSGYDVAFYNSSTGLYNIWSVDSTGHYTSNLASGISATSATLENYETIFQQDLNNDGNIGPPPPPPPTVVEHSGATALLQAGGDYFLNPVSNLTTVSGPELMYGGAPVTVGEWAGWAPVAAEQVGSRYDVAFYNASTGLFNIWSVDSTGHYVSNLASGISGTSTTLENFEATFQQDLNNDGSIGPPPPPPPPPPTVVEHSGATALLQAGGDYFLNPVSNLTTVAGPELMFNGSPVTVGMWAGWAPVAAEQVSGGGYDVAFYNSSTGLYNIWSVDSTGHYISNLASGIAGTSTTLENYETTFQQDLNNDGSIGPPPPPPPTVIEHSGATALLQSGGDYFLNPVSNLTTVAGPELMFNGSPVTVGMWTGWAPVAAEQVSGGYDVAFYNASTGLYNIWSVDSTGHYISNLASGISGTSTTLENFETTFQQDLNNDGHIGVPTGTSPATSVASNSVSATTNSLLGLSPDHFHFGTDLVGQTSTPSGGAAATIEHEAFLFSPGPIGGLNAATAMDTMPISSAALINIHAALSAAHDDVLGNPSDLMHLLANHSDFHLI
jgi:serralysin